MAKMNRKKMAKATLKNDTARRSEQLRRELARDARNEKQIVKLSKQLRRLLQSRDYELQVLAKTIGIFRGEQPTQHGRPGPVDHAPDADAIDTSTRDEIEQPA